MSQSWFSSLAIILSLVFWCGSTGVSSAMAAATKKTMKFTGRVLNMQEQPLSDVEVKLEMEGASDGKRSMKTNAQGEFSADVKVDFTKSNYLKGKLSAKKAEYEQGLETFSLQIDDKSSDRDIVLCRSSDWTNQLSISALIKSMAPLLKQNAEKDFADETGQPDFVRGYELLLAEKNPEETVELLRKSVDRASDCLECQVLLSLALMNTGSWSGVNVQMEEAALISDILETKRPEFYLVKGVIEAWRGRDKDAVGFLMKGLELNPKNALALQELGRAGIAQRKWEAAEQFLSRALQAGAGEEARFMRARTLLEIGEVTVAADELEKYVGGQEIKNFPQEVRTLHARIQDKITLISKGSGQTMITEPLEEIIKTVPILQGVNAATDQDSLENLLTQIGKGVETFFRDIPNTSSVEQVRQERLNKAGKVSKKLDQEFLYIMLSQTEEPGLGIHEYRSTHTGSNANVGGLKEGLMLTSGFASASSIFHPTNRKGTDFKYLGKQTLDGREAYVIAFAQKPALAKMVTYFRVEERLGIALVHGIAWVDAKSLSIFRLHTYLLNPLPLVRLQKMSTEIQYQEVTFNGLSTPLLLPKEVSIMVDWRSIVLQNHHKYSDFQIFSVESKEERKPMSAPDRIVDPETGVSLNAK
jgi:tetratricopeptide (TPR) repeat protein